MFRYGNTELCYSGSVTAKGSHWLKLPLQIRTEFKALILQVMQKLRLISTG